MERTALTLVAMLVGLSAADTGRLAGQQPSIFQELGVFMTTASSGHRELPSPVGFGARASWDIGGILQARLSFARVTDETRKEGIVCDQYSQRINCRPEMTETSVTLSGLRGALLGTFALGDRAVLGAGGGPSFNHVNAESVGTVSGLEADLLAPNAGIIGFQALVSLSLLPVRRVPLHVNGGVGVHWVNFHTCSANDPPQYDPYCRREAFREIEVGVSYLF